LEIWLDKEALTRQATGNYSASAVSSSHILGVIRVRRSFRAGMGPVKKGPFLKEFVPIHPDSRGNIAHHVTDNGHFMEHIGYFVNRINGIHFRSLHPTSENQGLRNLQKRINQVLRRM
jgi:hypothetical protein